MKLSTIIRETLARPGNLLKQAVRKIYSFYAKVALVCVSKVSIPTNEHFLPPDYGDLHNLFRLAMKLRPRVSLEIGSGYSTLVFAEALRRISEEEGETSERVHYCLEQDETYLELIKQYIGPRYSKYVKFVKTSLLVREIAGQRVSVCTDFPDQAIDLFYEDRTDHPEFPIAGDALVIETDMPDTFTICVDGMRSTVDFYERNLKREYRISGRTFHGTNFVASRVG
jgi:hypothetical protein